MREVFTLLSRRKRLAAATFVATLMASAVVTGLTPVTYESEASLVAVNERDAILTFMQSDGFATAVAVRLGLAEPGNVNDPVAAESLRSRVEIGLTLRPPKSGANLDLVTIRARAEDPEGAVRIANAYLATLASWRPELENRTISKNWQEYYEQAGNSEPEARKRLEGLVAGITYYRVIDEPVRPQEPVSPNWAVNITIATVLGLSLSFLTPLLAESVRIPPKTTEHEQQRGLE